MTGGAPETILRYRLIVVKLHLLTGQLGVPSGNSFSSIMPTWGLLASNVVLTMDIFFSLCVYGVVYFGHI